MSKRNIGKELIEGFDALKAEREGRINLRRHAAESKAVPKKTAMSAKLKMTPSRPTLNLRCGWRANWRVEHGENQTAQMG